jgi:hypothetical protein
VIEPPVISPQHPGDIRGHDGWGPFRGKLSL